MFPAATPPTALPWGGGGGGGGRGRGQLHHAGITCTY